MNQTRSALNELRSLLNELPLDEEQRESVSANLSRLSTEETRVLLDELKGTLDYLEVTLKEADDLMTGLSTVRIASDVMLGKVFEASMY